MSLEKEFMIVNELGLHARPATQVVNLANKFESEILLTFNAVSVDMKSIMGVLSLGVTKGSQISVRVDGPDEVEALKAISDKITELNVR